MRYIIFAALLLVLPVDAAYTLQKGRLVNTKDIVKGSAEEHFQKGIELVRERKWHDAEAEFRIICKNYPETSLAQEAEYYWSVCDYWEGEFEFANEHADNYLKSESNPPFLMSAIEVKFYVAEAFRQGAKRRFWGKKQLPKWVSGKNRALDIYDEVIAAAPSSPIAVRALYGKAQLLSDRQEYDISIDTYKIITRRFPTHELALESYLAIARSYLTQAKKQFQNPELLSRAELNARKFEEAFPGDPRVDTMYLQVGQIRETYAKGLLEIANYYERKKKPDAAVVYYKRAVERFPNTEVASVCLDQLRSRGVTLPEGRSIALFGDEEKVQ